MRPTLIPQRPRLNRTWPALVVLALGGAALPATTAGAAVPTAARSAIAAPASEAAAGAASKAPGLRRSIYRNPVSRSFADTYADPSVIRGKDGWWYAYGTTDPLLEGEEERHFIPISRSRDLVNWRYVGDAFREGALPRYADVAAGAALWAPEIHYVRGQYRLYYVVTQTTVTPGPNDNAIGMATAPTPVGPWTDTGRPVVGPRPGASGNPDDFLWTYDPDVVTDTDGSQHLYYGSYYGGIFHSRLDASGRRAVGASVRVAIDNKFEGAYVTRKGGYWYLFASTANCCAGPTTGYSVHVGRSRSLTGPFVDRQGVSLNVSRAGGTPVLYQNGNRWIGAGHNTLARDDRGQDWILYHAIDRSDPWLNPTGPVPERPMLIDRLDWVRGWPLVRGGCGPSETPQIGPAVRRPGPSSAGRPAPRGADCRRDFGLGRLDRSNSDEFNGSALRRGWQRLGAPSTTVSGGRLNWATERGDLGGEGRTASVLLRRPSTPNWTVETKVTINLGTDTVRNYEQAGLVAYVNDDLWTRLSHVAIWNTRQTEFGKEMPYVREGATLSYGGTIVGPPADTTWLRITARTDPRNGELELTPFTSRDGRTWVRGGTWTLPAGSDVRVGLVSQGRREAAPVATARFDYFRLFTR
jgi:arabinan endo-1,5-alpha-L-arabinosidase